MYDGFVIVLFLGVGGGNILLLVGVGGGFVKMGFFVDMIINLGFVGGVEGFLFGVDGGFGYNFWGLKCDVGLVMNMWYVNYSMVFSKYK